MPRVFITGLGFITSIGNDVADVSRSLRELRHGIELYPPFQKPEIPCKLVGTIKGFATDFLDPEEWTWPARYTVKRDVCAPWPRTVSMPTARSSKPLPTLVWRSRTSPTATPVFTPLREGPLSSPPTIISA